MFLNYFKDSLAIEEISNDMGSNEMAKKALEGNYKVTRDKIAKKFKICESQNKCNYSNLLVEIKNDRIDEQVISFISCALNEVCKKMDKQKTHEFS